MDSTDRMVQVALIAGAACLTVGLLRKLQGRSLELKQTEGSCQTETGLTCQDLQSLCSSWNYPQENSLLLVRL